MTFELTDPYRAAPINGSGVPGKEGDMATKQKRTNRRAVAPKVVREVARAANLDLRGLGAAILDGQPFRGGQRDSADQNDLLRWLAKSARNAAPVANAQQIAERVATVLREMAESGDATAQDILNDGADEILTGVVRVEIALIGAPWQADTPEVPKRERLDAIATTVLKLTGWPAVPETTVEAIYWWLFGDEARYVHGADLRMQAGQLILENPRLQVVPLFDRRIGKPVLVTREEIRDHLKTDLRMMLAADAYLGQQIQSHSRVLRLLEPYAREGMKMGDIVLAAARAYGIDTAGRSAEDLIDEVLNAAEARRPSPA